jgi:HEAT repeat protein
MKRCCRQLILALVGAGLCTAAGRAADEPAEKIAAAVSTAQNWKDGDAADALNYLAGVVIQAAQDPVKRKAIEQSMIAGLAGAKTRAGKDFFCRQLVVVGTEAAVPELAKLLTDPESSHMGRYALARIPGQAADAALLAALARVDDKLKIGMVNSLGMRGCREAADKIAALLNSSHEDLVIAALVALGRIDSEAAVAAVAQARGTVPAKLKPAATDAYLNCAARMVKQGRADAAVAIYKQLLAPHEAPMCRVAALTGLVAAQPDQSAALAIAALNDKDAKMRGVAVSTLRAIPGEGVTKAIVAALASQSEDGQVMLLSLLADRGDRSALPAVVKAVSAAAPAVRLAALGACAVLGDDSVVPLLLERAAAAQEAAEQQAAHASLRLLRGPGISATVARLLAAEAPRVRVEAARALAARGATDQLPALLRAAEDQTPAASSEALKSLRTLATVEHLPVLLKLLVGAKDGAVRGEAENTVVMIAKAAPENSHPVAPVIAAVAEAKDTVVRASLVRVLGRIGAAAAIPTLYSAVKEAAPEVKDAAIRALADWPTGEPAKVLLGIATDAAAAPVHRVLSLRGYVNLIAKQPDVSDVQILADYNKALELAGRVEEKQLVLSKLALVRDRRALEMVQRLAADPALKQSAEAALENIQKLLAAPAKVTASKNPEKAQNAIDKDPNTRWDTGAAQEGGEWFRIELDGEHLISAVVLDTRGSGGDYPRGYEVYVSASSLGEGKLAIKGEGNSAVTRIAFKEPVRGKAIKIVQTGRVQGLFWSIHELTVESKPVP